MIRISFLILLSWLLNGCASMQDTLSGPDPLTYRPIAIVKDADAYEADLGNCHAVQSKTPSGLNGGSVAVSGVRAAVSNAPAAAASVPLYGVEIGAGVGSELLDQATGSRLPRMRSFMDCIRNITNQDKSAVVADPN